MDWNQSALRGWPLAALLCLAGCGGGGDEAPAPAAPAPPILAPQSFTADEDASFDGRMVPSDTAGTVRYSIAATTAHGSVAFTDTATGAFRYTPAPDFAGTDTFQARAESAQAMATATISIVVRPQNDPPSAADDGFRVKLGETAVLDVLANDRDVDGDTLAISITRAPPGAQLTVAGGMIQFTPDAGVAGPTDFAYRITDAAGITADASVRVVMGATPPVFFVVIDTAGAKHVFRHDFFGTVELALPLPAGDTLEGFSTSSNGLRLVYVTRSPGTPLHQRVFVRDLADLSSPVREIATPPGSYPMPLVLSPDGRKAVMASRAADLDTGGTYVLDAGVQSPQFTRDSSRVFYSTLQPGNQRETKWAVLGPTGATQHSITGNGLGLQIRLSPDETLVGTQGLVEFPTLQTRAFVTRADGADGDRQISPPFTNVADYAPAPGITPDNQYAYFDGTIDGVTGVYAAALQSAGFATRIYGAPAGEWVAGVLAAADSRTYLFAQGVLNGLGPGTWYRGRFDQPGVVTPYAPFGAALTISPVLAADGRSLLLRNGTGWYLASAPAFDAPLALYQGDPSPNPVVVGFSPDLHAIAVLGNDPSARVLLLNPHLPGWSRTLPLPADTTPQCAVWAGSFC